MPRLQYNNPAIKFDVQKVKEAGVAPELTIEFGKSYCIFAQLGRDSLFVFSDLACLSCI
jgi:hypothetical protein